MAVTKYCNIACRVTQSLYIFTEQAEKMRAMWSGRFKYGMFRNSKLKSSFFNINLPKLPLNVMHARVTHVDIY